MLRILSFCFVITIAGAASGYGQGNDQQENPAKKFALRPSSKEYTPLRRGNSFQPVIRSKTPTLKSQQSQAGNKKDIKQGRKTGKHHRAGRARKNWRIRNK